MVDTLCEWYLLRLVLSGVNAEIARECEESEIAKYRGSGGNATDIYFNEGAEIAAALSDDRCEHAESVAGPSSRDDLCWIG